MSARAYVLTRGAAADLREISRYTAKTWSATQRQSYVRQLEDAAAEVALGQGVFKNWDMVLPGLRVRRAGRHYLFCLPRANAPALILAILHERMDLMARLKGRVR